ncbi:ATP-binding protein [Ancylothrix sp. C2]|uniref:hybrid sensor histidine kinase/response regulator n=1 Tax=Ancylothrix sp. D3o TaxID=2953691 RepID=UPI0021BAB430|nr:ATP-binding protein [Ancylothrix sp. D3o]MCT7948805.1 ATP-binding protein [Ancylothrix sp. D3o]
MKPVKILIVEDESIVAMDIADKLERLGYEVSGCVDSGELAIETVAQTQPDLVLMDIVLQGDLDGIQTADHIKNNFQIPVVYLTAYADKNTLQRAKLTEPYGYLLKPFKEAELNATIEMALSRINAENKINQQLKLSEQLRQKAEQLSEIRSRYLCITSHEFRTPLSIISLSAELLKEYNDKMSTDKKNEHLNRIQRALKNINQLLEEVLTLGKAEAGQIKFYPERIELSSFCYEIIDEQLLSYHYKTEVEFLTKGECGGACMDRKLLRHILTNLISNAIKYSPDGTPVSLTLTCENNQAIFTIQDHGIGIPPQDRERLFEPFHRAINVGSIPGTGLGLAIVKQCVDLHGGEIWVESQENINGEQSGTTFTVSLPFHTKP